MTPAGRRPFSLATTGTFSANASCWYERSHAVTGGRAQAGSACQRCQKVIVDKTRREKQGTAFFFCPSVNEGTRLWPFSTGEAEPDEASVGMRYPESLHPFAHHIQPILRAKREIRKEYGTVFGQQVLNMTGRIGPRECQILWGEGGKWV
jgi:hypothetical protein